MNKSKNQKLITKNELCEVFSISGGTVTNWVREGCPSVCIGKFGKGFMHYFRVAEVEAWLKNRSGYADVEARLNNRRERQKTSKKNGFINRRELCKFFNVSKRTVTNWLRDGCPCTHTGKRGKGFLSVFRVAEVEAWLNNRAGYADVEARLDNRSATADVEARSEGEEALIADAKMISKQRFHEFLADCTKIYAKYFFDHLEDKSTWFTTTKASRE